MLPILWLADLDQLRSSHLILISVVGLALVAGLLFYIGLLGWVIQVLGTVVRGAVQGGFLLWQRLFAWAWWPAFLAIVLGLLGVGCAIVEPFPGLAVVCGLVPLLMGVTACFAYMFIDLERYEVERGYKAVHNPMKGQELDRKSVV